MKRYILVFALVAVGLSTAFVALERTSQAISHPGWTSGPLLSCPDVDGNGAVGIPDVLAVASSFGQFGMDNYAYLYDVVNGEGVVNVPDDIMYTASRFTDQCTDLIEQQIALATRATMKYRDCSSAAAQAEFGQNTQYIDSMGIHMSNNFNAFTYPDFYSGDPSDENDQLRHPTGIMCTDKNPDPDIDDPDQLIGMWYVIPVEAVCEFFRQFLSIPYPCQDETVQPVGFGTTNEDLDNQWMNSVQRTWHTHPGLCVGGGIVGENVPEANCGGLWFSTYGWMIHLYSYIPNQDGPFRMWSEYVNPLSEQ